MREPRAADEERTGQIVDMGSIRERQPSSGPRPEVTAPGTEKPRWSAAGRASFAKDAHAARRELNGCASRRSIPSGLPEGPKKCPAKAGRDDGAPAPQRIGAMALGCLKFESDARRRRNIFCVMPGLDAGIHDERQQMKALRKSPLPRCLMDCRVKPGNDGGDVCARRNRPLNAASAFPRPPRATASARSNPPAPPRPRARRLRPASRWSRSNPAGRCR